MFDKITLKHDLICKDVSQAKAAYLKVLEAMKSGKISVTCKTFNIGDSTYDYHKCHQIGEPSIILGTTVTVWNGRGYISSIYIKAKPYRTITYIVPQPTTGECEMLNFISQQREPIRQQIELRKRQVFNQVHEGLMGTIENLQENKGEDDEHWF